MSSVRAYIGLGANLGEREAALAGAVRALGELGGARVAGVSRLYATHPVGPPGQPEFRNAVVALDVAPRGTGGETGAALLHDLKALERRFGRRPRERWGPRELDLDLLLLGRRAFSLSDPPLTVPHPLARERLFVLAPLRDLAPRLVPPGWDETVAGAYRRQLAAEGADAVRPIGRWDAQTERWILAGDVTV